MSNLRRLCILETTEQNRKDSLARSLEEKRALYRCREDFFVLDDIPDWNDYFKENQKKLDWDWIKRRSSMIKRDFKADERLNEKISIFEGDITCLEIDAIVNAAKKSLLGGGGVDGAIHRAAGKELVEECETLLGCDTGEAKITAGYKLPAKYVIHTVGPIGEKPDLLKNCYINSLKLAVENNCRTIAFPCISTGVYGYPNEPAAMVVLETIRDYLESNADKFDRIIFCIFLSTDLKLYQRLLYVFFPIVPAIVKEKAKMVKQQDAKQEEEEERKKESDDKVEESKDDRSDVSKDEEKETSQDNNSTSSESKIEPKEEKKQDNEDQVNQEDKESEDKKPSEL